METLRHLNVDDNPGAVSVLERSETRVSPGRGGQPPGAATGPAGGGLHFWRSFRMPGLRRFSDDVPRAVARRKGGAVPTSRPARINLEMTSVRFFSLEAAPPSGPGRPIHATRGRSACEPGLFILFSRAQPQSVRRSLPPSRLFGASGNGGRLFFQPDELVAVKAEGRRLPVLYRAVDEIAASAEHDRGDRCLFEQQ